MARIKIEDLPVLEDLSESQLMGIYGGFGFLKKIKKAVLSVPNAVSKGVGSGLRILGPSVGKSVLAPPGFIGRTVGSLRRFF